MTLLRIWAPIILRCHIWG